jgi:hypothetical protein
LELTLTFGRRLIALPSPLLRPFFEADRASPPAAPAIAAPPATSGTFALLAALPTVLPALLALPPTFPPTSPTAWRTASTFECLLDEPLLEGDFRERDLLLALEALAALAPLLELRDFELRDLLLVDFDLAFDAFDFDDDFALFGADSFRDLGFDLAFVWAIVPLLATVSLDSPPTGLMDRVPDPKSANQVQISMDGWLRRSSLPRRRCRGSASAG